MDVAKATVVTGLFLEYVVIGMSLGSQVEQPKVCRVKRHNILLHVQLRSLGMRLQALNFKYDGAEAPSTLYLGVNDCYGR